MRIIPHDWQREVRLEPITHLAANLLIEYDSSDSTMKRNPTVCPKYTFQGRTGYIVGPDVSTTAHALVSIRHSAAVQPWADHDVHQHHDSEEFYFVFQGKIELLVADGTYDLMPCEALMIKPQTPHAVIGGEGPIEHFVLRMPAIPDRQTVCTVPARLPPGAIGTSRIVRCDWGCRAPLSLPEFQNCWLFGVGQARFLSDRMCLAYLNFPTIESANANRQKHHHQMHLHTESWEYYVVLQGVKILQIEDELVEVEAGEILEVTPYTGHVLRETVTPFEGFTFRYPRLDDKVEY